MRILKSCKTERRLNSMSLHTAINPVHFVKLYSNLPSLIDQSITARTHPPTHLCFPQIDHQPQSGNTALHLAALKGHEAVAKLLIDRGAKIDIADKVG